MSISVSQLDPEVNQLLVMDRSRGQKRVIADLDADLSRRPRKRYRVRVIQRQDGETLKVLGAPARKKQSKALRPVEKATRKSARRTIRFMQDYLYLHERSNKKKKNGWLRSYVTNLRKAFRRSRD